MFYIGVYYPPPPLPQHFLHCPNSFPSRYVEGGSLLSLLSDFGVFPESLCIQYIQQVLLGLAYLHSQKIVHRDVKAANILITKKGKVKLCKSLHSSPPQNIQPNQLLQTSRFRYLTNNWWRICQWWLSIQRRQRFEFFAQSNKRGIVYSLYIAIESQMNVGSPFWMAPEVIEMSTATTASDIWYILPT